MQTESRTPLSPNHPSTALTCTHNTQHTPSKCSNTRQSVHVKVCVWRQKWAVKVSHSIKLLIWFCRRREDKSVFPVDWNGETYARTGSDCRTKSFRVYWVHTQFFSERRNTAHKIMSLKEFSWTATKPQTKGPAATNPHWPAELPWCSLMLSCPGPVLFSQRIHTRPVMNIQEFSPLQDYPLFL